MRWSHCSNDEVGSLFKWLGGVIVKMLMWSHPYISLAVVCPFVRLSIRLSVRYVFSNPHRVAKWTLIFNKPSAYIKFGLQNSLKLSRQVHVPVCMHMHPTFVPLLLFLPLSWLKMKKNEATLQIGMDKTQLFCFIHFFQFSKELLKNGWNVPKKGQNSTFYTLGGQNMTQSLGWMPILAHGCFLVWYSMGVWAEGPHTQAPNRG